MHSMKIFLAVVWPAITVAAAAPHNCSIHCIVKLLKYIRYQDRQHENKKIFHDRTADQIDLSVPFLYHLFYVILGISLIAFKSCVKLNVIIIAF